MSRLAVWLVVCLLTLGPVGCARPPQPVVPPAPPPVDQPRTPEVREPVQEPHPLALEIADFQTLAQDPGAYLGGWDQAAPLLTEERSQAAARRFEERFFAPWEAGRPAPSVKDAAWGFSAYGKRRVFGENLRPRRSDWTSALEFQAGLADFPNLVLAGRGRPALAVRHTSLRVMPTDRPLFLDPALPGEGFPFDQLQQSGVWAGTPLCLLHASRDGAWFWAESPFASGWLPAADVAFADQAVMARYRTGRSVAPVVDDLPLRDPAGNHLLTGRIGMVLPAVKTAGQRVTVLVPVADEKRRAVLVEAETSLDDAPLAPLPAAPERFAAVARRLMGQAYGWGGLYGDRDCSALTRDLYAPFGLWLPRNSASQARQGVVTSFKGWSASQKESWLLQRGMPFLTLVWMKGHVMLFIGEHEGRAVVLHALWGLRTETNGVEGRKVIGESVITTLTPGAELPNLKASLLDRLEGASVITGGGE